MNPKDAEKKPIPPERIIDANGWEVENPILSQEAAELKEEESQGEVVSSQQEADQKEEDSIYTWEPPSPSI